MNKVANLCKYLVLISLLLAYTKAEAEWTEQFLGALSETWNSVDTSVDHFVAWTQGARPYDKFQQDLRTVRSAKNDCLAKCKNFDEQSCEPNAGEVRSAYGTCGHRHLDIMDVSPSFVWETFANDQNEIRRNPYLAHLAVAPNIVNHDRAHLLSWIYCDLDRKSPREHAQGREIYASYRGITEMCRGLSAMIFCSERMIDKQSRSLRHNGIIINYLIGRDGCYENISTSLPRDPGTDEEFEPGHRSIRN